MPTPGEILATHAEQIGGLRAEVDTHTLAMTAISKRLDARPSWAVCVMLSTMGSAIGALSTFIASHTWR